MQDPKPTDGGSFKCTASNDFGESNANITLNFQGMQKNRFLKHISFREIDSRNIFYLEKLTRIIFHLEKLTRNIFHLEKLTAYFIL